MVQQSSAPCQIHRLLEWWLVHSLRERVYFASCPCRKPTLLGVVFFSVLGEVNLLCVLSQAKQVLKELCLDPLSSGLLESSRAAAAAESRNV